MGDFNARVQVALTPEQQEFIGQHTMEPETADPVRKADENHRPVPLTPESLTLFDFCHARPSDAITAKCTDC